LRLPHCEKFFIWLQHSAAPRLSIICDEILKDDFAEATLLSQLRSQRPKRFSDFAYLHAKVSVANWHRRRAYLSQPNRFSHAATTGGRYESRLTDDY